MGEKSSTTLVYGDMNRYGELAKLCKKRRPKRILEIGTWNGDRAIQLCSEGAEYVGFDLFEEADFQTDVEEKNVKRHFSEEEVSKRLKKAGVQFKLVKGNTRQTLPEYEGEKFDFAWIDGGHSLETITSDWNQVRRLMKSGSMVVFDDYYEPRQPGFGCNEIVNNLEDVEYSKHADFVKGGGAVRWAAVEL